MEPLSSSEKKLMKKLHERERFFEQLSNHAPDIIYVLDLKTNRFTYMNKREQEVMGAENIMMDQIHPSDFLVRKHHIAEYAETVRDFYRALGEAGDSDLLTVEYKMRTKAGEEKWMALRGKVLNRHEDGSVAKVLVIGQFITERKISENKIKEQAEFISRVTQLSPDVINVYDYTLDRYVFANRELYRLLGIAPNEIKNTEPHELLVSVIHPEDNEVAEEFKRRLKIAKDGEVIESVCRMKHVSGEWLYFEMRGIVFRRDPKGNVTQYLSINQDITEKRQAELSLVESKNTLEAVFKSVPNKIALFKSIRNAQGQIEDFEYTLANFPDKRNKSNVVGKRLSGTHTRIKDAGVLQKMIDVVETGNESEWQQVYSDETHNGWYYLKVVKLDDGCVMTSISLASLLPTEPNAQDLLRAAPKGGSPSN